MNDTDLQNQPGSLLHNQLVQNLGGNPNWHRIYDQHLKNKPFFWPTATVHEILHAHNHRITTLDGFSVIQMSQLSNTLLWTIRWPVLDHKNYIPDPNRVTRIQIGVLLKADGTCAFRFNSNKVNQRLFQSLMNITDAYIEDSWFRLPSLYSTENT
jgi:hypothetical protein